MGPPLRRWTCSTRSAHKGTPHAVYGLGPARAGHVPESRRRLGRRPDPHRAASVTYPWPSVASSPITCPCWRLPNGVPGSTPRCSGCSASPTARRPVNPPCSACFANSCCRSDRCSGTRDSRHYRFREPRRAGRLRDPSRTRDGEHRSPAGCLDQFKGIGHAHQLTHEHTNTRHVECRVLSVR